MRRAPRLVPLGARLPREQAEVRLRQAWPFVVGPSLADCSRPLRVERDILVMGCWDLTRIGHLRDAAVSVWPQLRTRIHRAVGLQLSGLQIVPCDPPAPGPEPPAHDPDPLRRALLLLEARRQERIRLGLESE